MNIDNESFNSTSNNENRPMLASGYLIKEFNIRSKLRGIRPNAASDFIRRIGRSAGAVNAYPTDEITSCD
jgi:hypothetical protein